MTFNPSHLWYGARVTKLCTCSSVIFSLMGRSYLPRKCPWEPRGKIATGIGKLVPVGTIVVVRLDLCDDLAVDRYRLELGHLASVKPRLEQWQPVDPQHTLHHVTRSAQLTQ